MHLVCPPKFCVTVVSNFSRVLQSSQEKAKDSGYAKLEEGGGGGRGETRCIIIYVKTVNGKRDVMWKRSVGFNLWYNGKTACSRLRDSRVRNKIEKARTRPDYALILSVQLPLSESLEQATGNKTRVGWCMCAPCPFFQERILSWLFLLAIRQHGFQH